ncbi:MAG: thiamine diphosphokinase [Acidimicrobiales bacterium]
MPAKEVSVHHFVVLIRVVLAMVSGMATQQSNRPRTAIIVMGGVRPVIGLASALEHDDALVITADSGAVFALAAGFAIDFAVGDFDSIPPPVLIDLEQSGVQIERHPAEKDATDLELAIDIALREGAEVITIVGGHGGRVDQSLANALLLASPRYAHLSMHALLDSASVSVAHGGGGVTFVGKPGDVVSLLPMHGDAKGVRTEGLDYPLEGETLAVGTTRGVSNVLSGLQATVTLEVGTLLVVRPGPQITQQKFGEIE